MSLNYQVYLVRPTPPATELETTTAPVLLVQGENPNVLAGTIVSAIEDSRRYVFLRQFACSVPNLVSSSAFIAHAGLGEMRRGRRCIVSRRGIPFFELEEIEHGQPIVVKARTALNFAASLSELIELPLRPPDTLESLATLDRDSDEESLMHLGGSVLHRGRSIPNEGTDLPTSRVKAVPFSLSRLAPGIERSAGFPTHRTNIWAHSEFIEELFAIWRDTALSWKEEAPAARVLTWLAAPGRGVRRCLYP